MKDSELKQWPDKADLSLVEPSIITDILNCQKLFKVAEDYCSNLIEYGYCYCRAILDCYFFMPHLR